KPFELDLAQLRLRDVARLEPRLRDLDRLRVAIGDVVSQLALLLLAHRLGEPGPDGVDDLAQRILGHQAPVIDALFSRLDPGAALHPDVDDLGDAEGLDRLP